MRARTGVAIGAASLLLGVGASHVVSDDDLDVVVLSGVDLTPTSGADMRPRAYLLPSSDGIVFVSAPLYSGSCAPTARASQDGNAIVLNIDGDTGGGACTMDAGPYTFVVSIGVQTPDRLVVEQSNEDDLDLPLTPMPTESETPADPVLLTEPTASGSEFIPMARVSGVLRQEGRCLVIGEHVAFWPKGTLYDGSTRALRLPDGGEARIDARLSGAGGYLNVDESDVSTKLARIPGLERCLRSTSRSSAVLVAAVS